MIIHILPGGSSHLTLQIVKNITEHSVLSHFFVIVNVSDEELYVKQFRDNSSINYSLLNSRERLISKLPLLKRFARYAVDIGVARRLWKWRKFSILSHGYPLNIGTYLFLQLSSFKISYVCWGAIADQFRLLHRIFYRINYRLFKSIVCLMNEDERTFRRKFNVKKTITMSYISKVTSFDDKELLLNQTSHNRRIHILIGNSAHFVSIYPEAVDIVKEFKNTEITCMLNYGGNQIDIKAFMSRYRAELGSRFKAWTGRVGLDEYVNSMKTFDIYICNISRRQTGLGAIYYMLMFGKKLYLRGKNLQWVKSLGFIVFDFDDIHSMSDNYFKKELRFGEKTHNNSLVNEILKPEKLSKKWDEYYSAISL